MALLPPFLFLPLKDNLKTRKPPLLTYSLIGISILVCLYQMLIVQAVSGECPQPATINEAALLARLNGSCMTAGAVIPADILAAFLSAEPLRIIGSLASMTGAMFVHESWHVAGGWQHLVYNMILIFAFGPALEARLGRSSFLALYFATSATSFLTMALIGLTGQMYGASGAAFGLIGAYLVLAPSARLWAAAFLPIPQLRLPFLGIPAFVPIPIAAKAIWIIPAYLAWSVIFAANSVAMIAHFIPFIAAYLIAWCLLRNNWLVPIAQAFADPVPVSEEQGIKH